MFKNIFYFKHINKIGGTEQFLYEIAKKYKNWDITVFYDSIDKWQLKRLKKYVRCRQRKPGEKIVCEKAFFNFNIDMIDDVEAKEYYFVSHANFEELGYKPPIENKKLTNYIGVSNFASRKLDEYGVKLGKNIKTIPCYNPLTLEPKERVINLVSACRLDDKVKGGERTLKLIEALDKYCEENGRHYIWHIYTNPNVSVNISSPNVVLMKPRVDVRPYIASADYVLQLSNDMETYCYTINEALGYGVPIITTPLSVIKELPIDENMRIELNWDCSNVDEVARQIFEKEVKPFEYKIPMDSWDKILEKGKSSYEEEKEMKVKVEAIMDFFDLEEKVQRINGESIWICSKERADCLVEHNGAKILEIIEEKPEIKVVEAPKVAKEVNKPKKTKLTKKK